MKYADTTPEERKAIKAFTKACAGIAKLGLKIGADSYDLDDKNRQSILIYKQDPECDCISTCVGIFKGKGIVV